MSRSSVFLGLTLAPALALAAPLAVSHQGRLLGAADAPVTRTAAPMTFKIYNVRNPGDASEALVWQSAACSVDVSAGYYAVALGGADCNGTPALSDELIPPDAPRFLEITIEGQKLLPRLALLGAPTAATATRAITADRAKVADDATMLAGRAASHYTDAANLSGTLGEGITYEGTPVANAFVAGSPTWNAKVGAVTAGAPLVAAVEGTTVALSLPAATRTAGGYLSKEDFGAFADKVASVGGGTGITIGGTATAPTIANAGLLSFAANAPFSATTSNGAVSLSLLNNPTFPGTVTAGGFTTTGTLDLTGGTTKLGETTITHFVAQSADISDRSPNIYIEAEDTTTVANFAGPSTSFPPYSGRGTMGGCPATGTTLSATYAFRVQRAGYYDLLARGLYNNDKGNVEFSIDSGTPVVHSYYINASEQRTGAVTQVLRTRKISSFNLTAGNHTLSVANKGDKLGLSSNNCSDLDSFQFVPTGSVQVPNLAFSKATSADWAVPNAWTKHPNQPPLVLNLTAGPLRVEYSSPIDDSSGCHMGCTYRMLAGASGTPSTEVRFSKNSYGMATYYAALGAGSSGADSHDNYHWVDILRPPADAKGPHTFELWCSNSPGYTGCTLDMGQGERGRFSVEEIPE